MTEEITLQTRGETRPRRRLSPALVLFFLSPMTAELLTGSAPPAEFFNPFMLLVLTALYGSGAILIRELALRWQKGWPTILMLGAAYGIVEEGLGMAGMANAECRAGAHGPAGERLGGVTNSSPTPPGRRAAQATKEESWIN